MLIKYEVIPITITALLHCNTRVSSNKGRVNPRESPMVSGVEATVWWKGLSRKKDRWSK